MTTPNNAAFNNVENLLAEYREAAEGTSHVVPGKANASQKKMHSCYKLLRQTEEGRKGIINLMGDKSPHVRCWAAAHSLAWFPEAARSVLSTLRDSRGSCSFDAEITLDEFDKGNLTFDY